MIDIDNLEEARARDVRRAASLDRVRRTMPRVEQFANDHQPAVRTASIKAVRYVMVLLRQLDDHNPAVSRTAREWWTKAAVFDDDGSGRVVGTHLSADQVSKTIDRLKVHLAAPAVQEPVEATPDVALSEPRRALYQAIKDVPEGRYALPVTDGPGAGSIRFFRVKVSKKGNKYMAEGHGGGFEDLVWTFLPAERGALAIVRLIAADPQEAMTRFGKELNHCGHCGRSLSNEESRRLGIGPYCRSKPECAWMVW